MCDYSLHHVASRPAKVRDKLVMTVLTKSSNRGFAAVGECGAKLVIDDGPPKVAVCLLPGTELVFDEDVQYERAFSFFGKARVHHKVARFRHVDMNDPYVQHDALEFPDGQILKVTQLVGGQTATVLQLPVAIEEPEHIEVPRVAPSTDSRVALNRGTTSGLMANQSAVMLWQAVRNTAIKQSGALAQSFRRLAARKQQPVVDVDDVDTIEPSFKKDALAVTRPKRPTEKQIAASAAA